MHLAQMGFRVAATDISGTAIRAARAKPAARGLAIMWAEDDILDTRLTGSFDLIFDRGCFHVLMPERRQEYVRIVGELLQTGGHLFLKCFSRLQPGIWGHTALLPTRFGRCSEAC